VKSSGAHIELRDAAAACYGRICVPNRASLRRVRAELSARDLIPAPELIYGAGRFSDGAIGLSTT